MQTDKNMHLEPVDIIEPRTAITSFWKLHKMKQYHRSVIQKNKTI